MWQVGSRGHVRCMVGIAVWGRMYGNREFGGEPGSLLLYIILPVPLRTRHSAICFPHCCQEGVWVSTGFSLLFDDFAILSQL